MKKVRIQETLKVEETRDPKAIFMENRGSVDFKKSYLENVVSKILYLEERIKKILLENTRF